MNFGDQDSDSSTLEDIGESLKGLSTAGRASKRGDSKTESYIRGRTYCNKKRHDADRSMRDLSNDLWEVYGSRLENKEFLELYKDFIEKTEDEKLKGKDIVRRVQDYL